MFVIIFLIVIFNIDIVIMYGVPRFQFELLIGSNCELKGYPYSLMLGGRRGFND